METRPRFAMKWYWLVLVAIIVIAIAPMVSVLVASSIAEAHGCVVNEAGVHPCLINGVDWGETLAYMAIMGWLMLASFPLGFVLIVIWLVVLLVHRAAWRGRQTKDTRS